MTKSQALADDAKRAAAFLKTLSNDTRLLILCLLAEREYSVGELEDRLAIRQPTLSQQLAILREEALVETRRDGKSIYYRLASPETVAVIELLYDLFCGGSSGRSASQIRSRREREPVEA